MAITKQIIGEWQGLANQGNVREILLVPVNNVVLVDSIIKVTPGTICTQPDLGYLSANWQEAEVDSPNGKFWDCSISWKIPQVNLPVMSWVQAMRYIDFIAIWRDANHNFFRTGSKQTPLRLFSNASIGTNETNFNLIANLSAPTYMYDSSIFEFLPDLLSFLEEA